MFRKLLVPLDRSPLAEQAIGQAVAIARASRAEIDLVLVHELVASTPFRGASWSAERWNDEQRYLESIAAEITSGSSVRVTHDILKGEVVETICSRIGETQADLIVMTSHGRTGLSRAWLGSVADGIVHHATIPVLMLRPIEGKARLLAAHHLFKRILVPLDGSAPPAEVLSAAASLARCSNAGVSLLRVVQPVPLISLDAGVPYASMAAIVDDPATKRLVKDVEEQLADVARQLREQTRVDVDAHVILEPRVASAILDFARAHDIDVIAMSTHGRGLSRFLLGSVADKVLRGSGTPVLMYHPVDIRAKGETAKWEAPALSHV